MLDDDADDATLLARHLDGDEAAFGVLVTRHRDRAWAVALRTLGDPADAADAVQDAFLNVFRQAAAFRGEAKFSTWLHRIVVNACVDLIRRRRARPAGHLDDSAAELIADPRDTIAEHDLAADVTAALHRIHADQRIAIVLVDLQGFGVDEAAAILGVPAGTVKSRCHRGRAQLAGLLGYLRPERTPQGTGAPTNPSEES